MAHLAILFACRDYATWKRGFDEDAPQRQAAGGINYQVYHMDGDHDNMVLILEWDSLENAKAFFTSDAARRTMIRAGVDGTPTFLYLNAGDSG